MAISFVGVGAASSGNNVSLTPVLPGSLSVGDLLIAFGMHRLTGSFATPSGWTAGPVIGSSGPKGYVFWRIYQSGDGNPTLTLSGGSANEDTIAQVCAFRGVDQTAPIDVEGSGYNAGNANIGPIPGITPTVANAAVVVAACKREDWTSVAVLSGDSVTWVEIGEPDSTAGTDGGLVWDYGLLSGTPTITDKTFTVTTGTGATGAAKMFSLKPDVPTVVPSGFMAAA